jgi:hypothetical protein
MDSGTIQPYFIDQIVGLDWSSGVSPDDLADALSDTPALQAIVIEYLDDDATFDTVEAVIVAIPDAAWRAAASDMQDQGIDMSGSESRMPPPGAESASAESAGQASAGS